RSKHEGCIIIGHKTNVLKSATHRYLEAPGEGNVNLNLISASKPVCNFGHHVDVVIPDECSQRLEGGGLVKAQAVYPLLSDRPLHVTQQVNDSPRGGGHFDFYPANDLTPDPEIALRLLQSAKINISLAVQRDIHRCGGRLHPIPMNGYRPVVADIRQYSTPDRRRDPQVAVNIAYQPVIL